MASNNTGSVFDDHDFMVGPTSQFRIKTQLSLLSLLLAFSIFGNGTMIILFARFKSLRRLSNYLLIDLTVVEFLDTMVNIPIFMEFFLLTKKKNLERQTRWYAMLFHRYFLLNDLFTQLSQTVDCYLAIKYGKQFTSKKSSFNVKVFVAIKWVLILVLLLVFSIPSYTAEEEYVSDEAYQRLLFGPNQVIWKIVIPSCQALAVVTILATNRLIKNSRNLVYKHYGMRVFGKGSKNSAKAVNTLTLIMVVQTLCKVPASAYSHVAVDDRIEGNRWFAFFSYFCLFLSSSVMPIIYFWRTVAFRRALDQFRKHPFAGNAYLDYAAHYGLKSHRNGRLHLDRRAMKLNKRGSPRLKEDCFTEPDATKETDLSSRTTQTSRLLSLATEASILELPMNLDLGQAQVGRTGLRTERTETQSKKIKDEACKESHSDIDATNTREMDLQGNEDLTINDESQNDTGNSEGSHSVSPSLYSASRLSKVDEASRLTELDTSKKENKFQEEESSAVKKDDIASAGSSGEPEDVVTSSVIKKEDLVSAQGGTTSEEEKLERVSPETFQKDRSSSSEEDVTNSGVQKDDMSSGHAVNANKGEILDPVSARETVEKNQSSSNEQDATSSCVEKEDMASCHSVKEDKEVELNPIARETVKKDQSISSEEDVTSSGVEKEDMASSLGANANREGKAPNYPLAPQTVQKDQSSANNEELNAAATKGRKPTPDVHESKRSPELDKRVGSGARLDDSNKDSALRDRRDISKKEEASEKEEKRVLIYVEAMVHRDGSSRGEFDDGCDNLGFDTKL